MSSRDAAWLERYKLAREFYADKRSHKSKPRKRSAKEEARLFVVQFLEAIGLTIDEVEYNDEWTNQEYAATLKAKIDAGEIPKVIEKTLDSGEVRRWYPLKGARHTLKRLKADRFGIARASAEWGDNSIIQFADPPAFNFTVPNTSNRLMNMRLLIDDGTWFSLIALTSKWHNLSADIPRAIKELPERPSLDVEDEESIGVVGVSVQVSEQRER